MPHGYVRLNERSQRPNALINFIKPLEGPDKAAAEDFLNRIAAQCYPVMKAAHISVMSLEEFEHNNEFLGRNFNAGECIQLVLKDRSGQWLGFKYVQMVMMHELAHCKQMNHSKYFWQVRNQYAQEMYDLWAKKYQGEGVWGRGQNLTSGSFVIERPVAEGDVPEHLCGGTYRRRGRKRKRGADASADGARPTYAERQQRRIAKKFGKHGEGNAVGEDDLVRGALEQGHRHQGKPRVANSKRGRELRAQAALARFEAAKSQQSKQPQDGETTDSSDVDWSDSDFEEDASVASDNGYIKVCDGEDEDTGDAKNEMDELRTVTKIRPDGPDKSGARFETAPKPSEIKECKISATVAVSDGAGLHRAPDSTDLNSSTSDLEIISFTPMEQPASITPDTANPTAIVAGSCPICSLENEPGSLLCLACSHVLRPKLVKNTWHCQSSSCRDSPYLNAGDAGRCGICGNLKPTARAMPPPAGPISADVLRWD